MKTPAEAAALAIPAVHQEAVAQFVDRVTAGCPEAAILAYGSAVRGGFLPDRSDINLLVIVAEVTAAVLEQVGAAAAAGRKCGLNPMVLARAELAPLAATAPLVLWDIADRRVLLRGDDPIAGLAFCPTALWHQLNRELYERLLGLRRLALQGRPVPQPERFGQQMAASLLHLCRGALRLFGRPADQPRVAALGDIARHLHLDLPTLQRLHSGCYGDDTRQFRDCRRCLADGQALFAAALARLAELDPATLGTPPVAPSGGKKAGARKKSGIPAAPASPAASPATANPAPGGPAPQKPGATGPAGAPPESLSNAAPATPNERTAAEVATGTGVAETDSTTSPPAAAPEAAPSAESPPASPETVTPPAPEAP